MLAFLRYIRISRSFFISLLYHLSLCKVYLRMYIYIYIYVCTYMNMCEYTPFTPGPPLSNCPLGYSVSQVRSAMRSWMDQLLNFGEKVQISETPCVQYWSTNGWILRMESNVSVSDSIVFLGGIFWRKLSVGISKAMVPLFSESLFEMDAWCLFFDEKHSSRKNGRMGWLPGWFFLVWHHLAALHQLRSKLAPCSTFLYMCHSAA